VIALVWPLPGIAITVAMQELAALNVTTGASRLVLSYFALIQLGLGTLSLAHSSPCSSELSLMLVLSMRRRGLDRRDGSGKGVAGPDSQRVPRCGTMGAAHSAADRLSRLLRSVEGSLAYTPRVHNLAGH
jgi:hypothetical protein